MSAVLLGVFKDYESANQARVILVRDGFPTDRVELTALADPGRAGLEPGETLHARFAKYFATLCSGDPQCAERLANALDNPGAIEIERALSILGHADTTELIRRGLENQSFEHAAARHERPWVRHFWMDLPEGAEEAHCIYCRLFERRPIGASESAALG